MIRRQRLQQRKQREKGIEGLIFPLLLAMIFFAGVKGFAQGIKKDTISIEKTVLEPGETLTIDYQCSDENMPYLWIGIFNREVATELLKDVGISIKILGPLNSWVQLKAPEVPGNYKVCLYARQPGDGSVLLHHRVDIRVKEKGAEKRVPVDNAMDFPTCPDQPLVTYMGKTYHTVVIGDQCWLRENLDVGKMIPGHSKMENNGIIEKYCYNDDLDNCVTYGGLYQWDELMQYDSGENTGGICPDGWHIPTQQDFQQLIAYLGGREMAGEKLKKAGSIFGGTGDTADTNKSGFSALPGGFGGGNGVFEKRGHAAYFASTRNSGSTELMVVGVVNRATGQETGISYTKNKSWNLILTENGLGGDSGFPDNLVPCYRGVAVRCMKNKQEPPPAQPGQGKDFGEQPPNTAPEACFKFVPIEGTSGTGYNLDPTCVSDKEDPDKDLRVRWDWDWRNSCTLFSTDPYDERHGSWDTSWRRVRVEEHHFKHSRIHRVRFQVKDSEGKKSRILLKKIKITGPNKGAAKFDIKPESKIGTKATDFTFTCTGSPLEADCSYRFQVRWDWDWKRTCIHDEPLDDRTGQWNTGFSVGKTAKHRYGKPGKYTVRMQVRDTDGHHYITTREVEVLKNTPPHACFKVSPETGTEKDWFHFDASCSWDKEDKWNREAKLKMCWIFNWDLRRTNEIGWSTKATKVKHEFAAPGDYKVRLGVMDTSGVKTFIFRTVTVKGPVARPSKVVPTTPPPAPGDKEDITPPRAPKDETGIKWEGCQGLVGLAKEGMAKIKNARGNSAAISKIKAEYEAKMKGIAQKRECEIPFKKSDKESHYSIKKITIYDAQWRGRKSRPEVKFEIEFSAKVKTVPRKYHKPAKMVMTKMNFDFNDKNGKKVTGYVLYLDDEMRRKGKVVTVYDIFYYERTAIIDFKDCWFKMRY